MFHRYVYDMDPMLAWHEKMPRLLRIFIDVEKYQKKSTLSPSLQGFRRTYANNWTTNLESNDLNCFLNKKPNEPKPSRFLLAWCGFIFILLSTLFTKALVFLIVEFLMPKLKANVCHYALTPSALERYG